MNIEIPSLKSLFIEMRFEDTLLSSATATLVAQNRDSHCALITARHNVTGRHQDSGECLHTHAAVPDSVTIYFHSAEDPASTWVPITLPLYRDDDTPFWIEHPGLGPSADIVALNLNWGDDVTKFPYYFETDLDRLDLAIGPAETVSVIGFPFGILHSGRFPVWATGFLAQEMAFVSDENPKFMIDCRTRPGQSGSPVIAFRPSGYRREQDGKVVTKITANKALGVLGRLFRPSAPRVRPRDGLARRRDPRPSFRSPARFRRATETCRTGRRPPRSFVVLKFPINGLPR